MSQEGRLCSEVINLSAGMVLNLQTQPLSHSSAVVTSYIKEYGGG